MKNKIGKIFLSLCMVLTLCMTSISVSANDGMTVNIGGNYPKDVENTYITNNFTSNDTVTVVVGGTEAMIKGNIAVPNGKTLIIKGKGTDDKVSIDHTRYGGIYVENGGELIVENVELSSDGTSIVNAGTTTIGDNTKITITQGTNILTKSGGATTVDGSNITITTTETDPTFHALTTEEGGNAIVKGDNYDKLVTINYDATSNAFPIDGVVELQQYVMLNDTSNTDKAKNLTEQERYDFAVAHVSDGNYMMNNRDTSTGDFTDQHYIIPTAEIPSYTDDSGAKLDCISSRYISTFDALMNGMLDYSEKSNKEITIDLIRDVETNGCYKVNAGQNIILNTTSNYQGTAADFNLKSTNEAQNGGAAFYVQDGQLTIQGNGSIEGARTGIHTPASYKNSKLIIAGDYTSDSDQKLTIKGGTYNSIHMEAGSLEIHKGNFVSNKKNLELNNVTAKITGGTYQQDISSLLSDGYTLRTNTSSPTTYTVVEPAAKDWWNANGSIESGKLYTYNSKLATTTNKNPYVWEVNGGNTAAGCGNVLAKTLSTTVDATYAFSFDFTNRINGGTSKEENTLSLYAYPGGVTGNITEDMLKKSVKIGDYYGSDTSWVHVSGEFKATSKSVTFFFKPNKSSGLGSIIDKSSVRIEKSDEYKLTDSKTDNLLQNGDFSATAGWYNFDAIGGLEFSNNVGTYTSAPKSPTSIAEVNAGMPDNLSTLNQVFDTTPQSRVQVGFDFIKRRDTSTDDINRFAVYIVDANKVKSLSDLDKYQPITTVVGNVSSWESASFICNIPQGQTKSMIVFKALTKSGGGIVLANASVKSLAWTPEIESITDTTLTVKALEGATYQLTDNAGNPIGKPQTNNVFKDLIPGTAYKVNVTLNGEVKTLEGVTMKHSGPSANNTVPVKVTAVGVNGVVITTASDQEYSIDNGKTWVRGNGDVIVFEDLKANTSYEILTRKVETFDTMYGASLKASVKTTEVVKPVVKERGSDKIVLTVVAGQEYSIDGGKVWLTPTAQTLEFTGLKANTEYTILTRVKGNDYFNPSEIKSVTAMTKIVVTGKAEGDDFPATVTITDKKTGKVVAVVTTDENGNWVADLDPGEYSYRIEGKDKKESVEGEFSVSETGNVSGGVIAKMGKYEAAKTSDSTLVIIPVIGLTLSIAVIWFVMRKKKASQEM